MKLEKILPYALIVLVLIVGYFFVKGQNNKLENKLINAGDIKVEMVFRQQATETAPAQTIVRKMDLDTLMNTVLANQEYLVNRLNKIDPPKNTQGQ